MSPENYTPLEIEYHEEGGNPVLAKLTTYIKQNKSLVFTVGSFAIISLLAVTTVVLSNVKEGQDIARAKAIEENNMQLVAAQAAKTPTPTTPVARVSVTRPPTRTPTPTSRISMTPTITSSPTQTVTPTQTLAPTILPITTPTNTPTRTPTQTPTQMLTPTITQTPTITPTSTVTPTTIPTPGSCTCVGSLVTEGLCATGFTATCTSETACVCNPP